MTKIEQIEYAINLLHELDKSSYSIITESEKYEHLVNLLADLSETDYIECQDNNTGKIVFISQNLQIIEIDNISGKVNLTLIDGEICFNIILPYLNFVGILERFSLLDDKLRGKIDILFNNKTHFFSKEELNTLFETNKHECIETEKSIIQAIDFNNINNNNKMKMIVTEAAIGTLNFMIETCFPELKETINVKVGNSRDEIVLVLKNGLEDPAFLKALPALILRKSFFENCKMWGIKKFIFIDEPRKGFDMIEIDDFDEENLF